jgi:hypothetical protein
VVCECERTYLVFADELSVGMSSSVQCQTGTITARALSFIDFHGRLLEIMKRQSFELWIVPPGTDTDTSVASFA